MDKQSKIKIISWIGLVASLITIYSFLKSFDSNENSKGKEITNNKNQSKSQIPSINTIKKNDGGVHPRTYISLSLNDNSIINGEGRVGFFKRNNDDEFKIWIDGNYIGELTYTHKFAANSGCWTDVPNMSTVLKTGTYDVVIECDGGHVAKEKLLVKEKMCVSYEIK